VFGTRQLELDRRQAGAADFYRTSDYSVFVFNGNDGTNAAHSRAERDERFDRDAERVGI
jgi:hypothetical protein